MNYLLIFVYFHFQFQVIVGPKGNHSNVQQTIKVIYQLEWNITFFIRLLDRERNKITTLHSKILYYRYALM